MKILFHLGHPAHFHLFRYLIEKLKGDGHEIMLVIKKKDVLQTLLDNVGWPYLNVLPEGRKNNLWGLIKGQFLQNIRLANICIRIKPDLLMGTSVSISHVGKLLGIPTFNVNEDDWDVVPKYAKLAYPWATKIFAPKVCRIGKWSAKKVSYNGYHELAYLHSNYFKSDKSIAEKYVNFDKKIFLLRFSGLDAHHDNGITGITNNIAHELITKLEDYGNVYISSERKLSKGLEKYRLNIPPIDIHHVMAFTHLFVSDSQTMCAESGVLGVPFVRFNDFVGKISYLQEMEQVYKLGYGFIGANANEMLTKISMLLKDEQLESMHKKRSANMLNDKIDTTEFFYKYINSYFSLNK